MGLLLVLGGVRRLVVVLLVRVMVAAHVASATGPTSRLTNPCAGRHGAIEASPARQALDLHMIPQLDSQTARQIMNHAIFYLDTLLRKYVSRR